MPDTERTRAAILALLADNTSGDISPQDVRDQTVSLYAMNKSMSVSAFNTETSNGTANPYGRGIVHLTDGDYVCVWNGTAWEYYVDGSRKATLITIADWTAFGSASANQTALSTAFSYSGGTIMGYYKAAPATPYTLTMLCANDGRVAGYPTIGLGWSDATKYAWAAWQGIAEPRIYSRKYSNASSYDSDYANLDPGGDYQRIWLQITDNGTNRIMRHSRTGRDWTEIHSVGRTDYFTPTQVFFGATEAGGGGTFYMRIYSLEQS